MAAVKETSKPNNTNASTAPSPVTRKYTYKMIDKASELSIVIFFIAIILLKIMTAQVIVMADDPYIAIHALS